MKFPRLASKVVGAALVAAVIGGCTSDGTRQTSDSAPTLADVKEQPPNAATLHAMARILAAQGRDGECEQVLQRVIQQEPGYLPAYSDLAELYMRHNWMELAMQALSAGLKQSPSDPVLLNNLGMCHLLKKEYDKALRCFEQACAASPANATYRANQATALGMLGQFDKAGEIYRQILDSPEDVEHNLNLLRRAYAKEKGTAVAAGEAHPSTSPSADAATDTPSANAESADAQPMGP